jgi:hypothetical protein
MTNFQDSYPLSSQNIYMIFEGSGAFSLTINGLGFYRGKGRQEKAVCAIPKILSGLRSDTSKQLFDNTRELTEWNQIIMKH